MQRSEEKISQKKGLVAKKEGGEGGRPPRVRIQPKTAKEEKRRSSL